jgi:hypothetical protein
VEEVNFNQAEEDDEDNVMIFYDKEEIKEASQKQGTD